MQQLWNYVNKTARVAAVSLLLAACSRREAAVSKPGRSEYEQTVRDWQAHRDAGLRSPDGWLTLVGLFWLKPGENSIGSAPSNDFVLPKGAPEHLGSLRPNGKTVTFTNLAESTVQVDGKPATAPMELSYDDDHPDVVRAGSISFFVIRRGHRLGVRVKDSASPVLKNFHGMHFFPIDPELHFSDARFVPETRKIPILNILGQTEPEESPGYVVFRYKGEEYRLRPIYEGDTLFFLFKDPTNKSTTYQAGRMLNTPLPTDGRVDLDFNRAYNPPCTFTPYATCPLPPKENALPFAVTAGEMRFAHSAD